MAHDEPALLARLTEAEALKQGVIDAALDAVITADRDCRVIGWNAAAERIFGHRRDEIMGRPIGDTIVPPHHRAGHEAGLARYHATGCPHVLGQRLEMEAMRADGSVFPCEMSIHEVKAAGRTFFTAWLRDLTPMRDAEAELARQRERLHQTEKMSALGSLLAGVAHELNNPLAVVVAQTTMLEAVAEDPAVRDRAARIHAAAARCGRIVKTFLAMVRQQPPSRSAVDLNGMLRGAQELVAYALRSAGIAVEHALSPGLPSVEADPDQLGQVAVNLLVNAQAALADQPEPRRLRIETFATPDGGAGFAVEDTGPGVVPAMRERIFEAYVTTKPLGAGTGLGLAVCRNILGAHGGTITLEDGLLGGARFVVRLPPGGGGTAAALPEAPRAAPRRRLLVVDDEPEVGEALADLLAVQGVAAEVVTDIPAALARLAQGGLDGVFCDLRMPGGGGGAFYRRAIAAHPGLRGRFCFVTGDTVAGPSAVASLDPDKPPPVLEKPFGPAEVAAALTTIAGP
ncbi:PAS domain S-box-containing protein [Falsiroseomonas stagni DSM 19981]|uniref:histidine kinase n=2 Tax=Falsiroseomonas TaxID=2870713 RepID=A0A1I3XCQ7_9PROT|nr:PAS domain S-box-containing protein [Falsiroseomonas stagni DSM 19981]